MFTKHNLIFVLVVLILPTLVEAQEYRAIDGSNNNLKNPAWGAVGNIQERLSPADYVDGISIPRTGADFGRPNPRTISNEIFDQEESKPDQFSLSDYTWAFGQFLDHDITLFHNGQEFLPIIVEEDDEHFKKGAIIPMMRNQHAEGTGEGTGKPREYVNHITSYVDGSTVYGSSIEVANWLRSFEGGKLKVSKGNLLPWNTIDGEFNSAIDYDAPEMEDATRKLTKFYVAGDVRANENPILLGIHTLFVREHNRICGDLAKENPSWDDEKLYQEARQLNVAYIQNIAFNEWLPAMGVKLAPYHRYHEDINPVIFNEFSTAAFRMGHTLISSELIRMKNSGDEMKKGRVSLRDAYFNPLMVNLSGGIEPFLIGMGTQVQQRFDNKMIDDLRSFLFGSGDIGLDLAALNILRGRERGLPDYNTIREYVGLPKVKSFTDITDDEETIEKFKELYGDVNNIDPWVGMVSESSLSESIFGELVLNILDRQFRVLRDGDRFYFENLDVSEEYKEGIRNTKMQDIIMRNADIDLMQKNVFKAMPHDQIEQGPKLEEFPLSAAVYPNPMVEKLQLKVYADKEQFVTVTFVSMEGVTVLTKRLHLYKGNNLKELSGLDNLPSGAYNVKIEGPKKYNILRVTKA